MVMEFNLLPYREVRRMRQRAQFFRFMGLSCAAALFGAFVVVVVFDSLLVQQRDSNDLLKAEIKILDVKIKQAATLQKDIAELKKRKQALDDLQFERFLPVHLMNALTAHLPNGILLIKVLQSTEGILISGDALSSDSVFEWMTHLTQKSDFFSKPELLEMRLGNSDGGSSVKTPVFRFGLRVKLQTTTTATSTAPTKSPLKQVVE
jgi:type IV pilus assembly protein PilN